MIRPSGTEPKIKIYILAHGESAAALDEKLASYREDAKAMAAVRSMLWKWRYFPHL